MLLQVLDGQGVPQTVVVNGLATPVNRSAPIVAANTAQILIEANEARGGYFIQNLGTVPLLVSEIDETVDDETSFQVEPLGTWPPANYPLTVGAIAVKSGEVGALVIAREW